MCEIFIVNLMCEIFIVNFGQISHIVVVFL